MIKVIITTIFSLFIFSTYSQEVYVGEFDNTPATFKSTNEPIGNRTYVQLQLNENNTYIIESYIYNKHDKEQINISCTKQIGFWSKKNNIIVFNPDSVNSSKNKEFRYKLINNRLFYEGSGKKYAKKTKLTKVKNLKTIKCSNLPKPLEPEW